MLTIQGGTKLIGDGPIVKAINNLMIDKLMNKIDILQGVTLAYYLLCSIHKIDPIDHSKYAIRRALFKDIKFLEGNDPFIKKEMGNSYTMVRVVAHTIVNRLPNGNHNQIKELLEAIIVFASEDYQEYTKYMNRSVALYYELLEKEPENFQPLINYIELDLGNE